MLIVGANCMTIKSETDRYQRWLSKEIKLAESLIKKKRSPYNFSLVTGTLDALKKAPDKYVSFKKDGAP